MEPTPQEPRLDGSWERSGRSMNSAALLALIGIGAVYFNVQSLLGAIAVGIAAAMRNEPAVSGSLLDRMADQIRFFAGPLRIIVTITQYFFMLLPALWIVRHWHSSTVRSYVRFRPVRPALVVVAVLATLALLPAANFIADEFVRSLRIPPKFFEINAEIFTSRSPAELIWLIIVVCLTPALCEETFFRGVVQRTFERTMGWKSVVLVGVLFGLFHLNPLGLVTLSVLGMLFGYYYFRSRSLVPSMAAHFTNNLLAVMTLYKSPSGASAISFEHLPLWLVLVTLPAGIAFLFLFDTMTFPRPAEASSGGT